MFIKRIRYYSTSPKNGLYGFLCTVVVMFMLIEIRKSLACYPKYYVKLYMYICSWAIWLNALINYISLSLYFQPGMSHFSTAVLSRRIESA